MYEKQQHIRFLDI